MYSFPNFEPVCCFTSGSNHCFLTCTQVLRRQVRWSGIPTSWRLFHSLLWSTHNKEVHQSQRLWCSQRSRGRFFSGSLVFSVIQWMLAIWSLIPLSFLNCGPLGKGTVNHFSILALRTSWTVKPRNDLLMMKDFKLWFIFKILVAQNQRDE